MIATLNIQEATWWSLSIAQRAHYERCVQAIVAYYHGDTHSIWLLIETASLRPCGRDPLVAAILWRLSEELA